MSAKGLVFKRITGLDPAGLFFTSNILWNNYLSKNKGPLFKKIEANDRLDIADAK